MNITLRLSVLLLPMCFSGVPSAQCESAGLFAGAAPPAAEVGSSLSVSGDTLLVGAPGAGAGAVYVFERQAGEWVEVQTLTPSDGAAGDGFGFRVSLSADLAVVGAPFKNVTGPASGAAYIFERSGGVWQEVERAVSSDNSFGDFLGIGVATDGLQVLVGGCQFLKFQQTGTGNGAVYLFERVGPDWLESVKLTAVDGSPGDRFGVAVDIEPGRLVCGAEDDDDFGTSSGSAYVFDGSGSSWVLSQKLTAADSSAGDIFGFDVALAGESVLVGAIGADGAVADTGAAYRFDRGAGTWAQSDKILAPNGAAGDQFGWSVALDAGALIGAPQAEGGVGRAYWTASGAEPVPLASSGAPGGARVGGGVALDSAGQALGVGAPGWGSGEAHLWSLSPGDCPSLFAWPNALIAALGGIHGFSMNAPSEAGDLYVLLGSMTGTSPGLPLGGPFVLPLNLDSYTLLTLQGSPIVGAVGILDAQGQGNASVTIPGNPAYAGIELHHAFVALEPVTLQLQAVSPPQPLAFF